MKKTLFTLIVALVPLAAHASVTLPTASPDSVLALALRANSYFMQQNPDPTAPTFVKVERSSNLWTRAVYYEGLMALHAVNPDPAFISYTDRWGDFHGWQARRGDRATNADNQCCQQIYLDRYMATGDEKMIAHVRENLRYQMGTKIGWWTWVDAIQMAMPVYSKMYRITGDEHYMDHAMKMYTWTRDTLAGGLFNEREGLWWRDKDFVPPYVEPDGSNCYWSRGCGWAYATLVRVLADLESRPLSKQMRRHQRRLQKDFRLMSRALIRCQRTDGFWNVSLLCPTNYGGPELTGTSLFLYGLSWGINHGLIKSRTYLPACHRAWSAMQQSVHPNGFLGYVQGTGKEPASAQPVTFDRAPDFEDYGLGCFLLGATEYYLLLQK